MVWIMFKVDKKGTISDYTIKVNKLINDKKIFMNKIMLCLSGL